MGNFFGAVVLPAQCAILDDHERPYFEHRMAAQANHPTATSGYRIRLKQARESLSEQRLTG